MVKRDTQHVFITVILLFILAFAAGIMLGKSMTTSRESEISKYIRDTELNTESYLIEQNLIGTLDAETCYLAEYRIGDLSKELWNIGRKLNEEGAREELGEREYNLLKRKYNLMQVRIYLLLNKLTENCNIDKDVILYYFSVDDYLVGDQGAILDQVVTDYDVTVFAIEYNYSAELSFLESYYQITSTPALILNYDTVIEGLTDYDSIISVLNITKTI